MSPTSKECFDALGQSSVAVGYLNNYLAALEPEIEFELHTAAEAALFDDKQKAAALVAFGCLEMVRRMRKQLEAYVIKHTQQYTR